MLLFSDLSGQIPKLFWDGYDWEQLGTLTAEYPEFALPMKRAYVTGILDGKYYYYLQSQAVDSAQADLLFRDYLNVLSLDELIRGTDEFYRNPANLYLPIISALAVTSLRASSFPDSVVSEYLTATRHWINILTRMYSYEVPVTVQGIDKPRFPRPAGMDLLPGRTPEEERWYWPDSLVLP